MLASRALDHALELARSPGLAGAMRRQELPPDVITLIRIAAGCPETCWEAVQATRQPPEALRESARTYLQLILFSDASDCFRTLGVPPGAPKSQMREHMRWLLQWLHPDRNRNEWESVYAERVIEAWREAKTRKRTLSPRTQLVPTNTQATDRPRKRGTGIRPPVRWIPVPIDIPQSRFSRPLRIGAAVLMLCLVVFAVPFFEPVAGWLAASGSADSRAVE
jgi:hypothetical protein